MMFKFRKMFQSYVWNIMADCVAEKSVIFGLLGIHPPFANKTLLFYSIEPSFCNPQAMWLGVADLLLTPGNVKSWLIRVTGLLFQG